MPGKVTGGLKLVAVLVPLMVLHILVQAGAEEMPAIRLGIVVDEVQDGSSGQRAGILRGDVLLAWEVAPDSGRAAGPSAGELTSVFDWRRVEIEESPRWKLVVQGLRNGTSFSVSLDRGVLGISARPWLPDDDLSYYLSGREKFEGGCVEEGVRHWAHLLDRWDNDSAPDYVCWLHLEISKVLMRAGRFDEAIASLRVAEGFAQIIEDLSALDQVLDTTGAVHERRGDFASAEAAYRWALGSGGRSESLRTARACDHIGACLIKRGDLDGAQRSLDRAFQVRSRLAPGSLELTETLNNLGRVAFRRGNLSHAESLFRQALTISEALAPERPHVASSLTNLGAVAITRGEVGEARALLERALAIRTRSDPESLETALILSNIGVAAWRAGDLDESVDFYEKALRIRERLAPRSPDVADSLNNLGVVSDDRGDLAAAEKYYRMASQIREERAAGSIEHAQMLHNLGGIALQRGNLAEAEKQLARALAIRERLAPGSLAVSNSLNGLGALAYYQGDLRTASSLFYRALAIKQEEVRESVDLAISLNDLAAVSAELGDITASGNFARQALGMLERLAPHGTHAAATLATIAEIESVAGQFESARQYAERALALRRELSPGSIDVAESLLGLGRLAISRGQSARAERYLRESLTIYARLSRGSRRHAEALHALGKVYRASGRMSEAAACFSQAVAVVDEQRQRLGGTIEMRSRFTAALMDYYYDYIDLLLGLRKEAEAFHVLERSRARSLIEMFAARDVTFSGIPTAVTVQQTRIDVQEERVLAEIASLDPQKRAGEIEQQVDRLLDLRMERTRLAERIRRDYPRLASLKYPKALDLDGSRQMLEPGTVLLSYCVMAEKSFLFAVTGDGARVYTLPLGGDRLRREVEAFRKDIEESGSLTFTPPTIWSAGSRLYDELLRPAEPLLAAARRVLICPDGPLHLLPFGALARSSGEGHERRQQFLVEWKPVHFAISATAYDECRRFEQAADRKDPPSELVAFGDPRYSATTSDPSSPRSNCENPDVQSPAARGLEMRALPDSRNEVEGIAALFPGAAVVYLGEEATEERAKFSTKGARYVHFACHGVFESRFPLDSCLVLTTPDSPSSACENGYLHAWEVLEGVRLDADLVTLSACKSGMGGEVRGEGLIGLTRAFQFAGARSVVASLWDVSDRTTAALMVRFYAYLKSGKSKDEALRQGQVDLISSPAGFTAHPYHWAAFQLIGSRQ